MSFGNTLSQNVLFVFVSFCFSKKALVTLNHLFFFLFPVARHLCDYNVMSCILNPWKEKCIHDFKLFVPVFEAQSINVILKKKFLQLALLKFLKTEINSIHYKIH